MADKIFVSFNFNDRGVTGEVDRMLKQLDGVVQGKWVKVENDVSYNGDTAIEWELGQVMSDCNVALFILGDNPRTSPWLEKEASLAIAREMPIIVTRLPNINCVKPEFMTRIHCQVVDWNRDSLLAVLNGHSTML